MPQPHLSAAYCDAYSRINANGARRGRADHMAIGIEPGVVVGEFVGCFQEVVERVGFEPHQARGWGWWRDWPGDPAPLTPGLYERGVAPTGPWPSNRLKRSQRMVRNGTGAFCSRFNTPSLSDHGVEVPTTGGGCTAMSP